MHSLFALILTVGWVLVSVYTDDQLFPRHTTVVKNLYLRGSSDDLWLSGGERLGIIPTVDQMSRTPDQKQQEKGASRYSKLSAAHETVSDGLISTRRHQRMLKPLNGRSIPHAPPSSHNIDQSGLLDESVFDENTYSHDVSDLDITERNRYNQMDDQLSTKTTSRGGTVQADGLDRTNVEPRCLGEICFSFRGKNVKPPSPELIVPVPIQRVSNTSYGTIHTSSQSSTQTERSGNGQIYYSHSKEVGLTTNRNRHNCRSSIYPVYAHDMVLGHQPTRRLEPANFGTTSLSELTGQDYRRGSSQLLLPRQAQDKSLLQTYSGTDLGQFLRNTKHHRPGQFKFRSSFLRPCSAHQSRRNKVAGQESPNIPSNLESVFKHAAQLPYRLPDQFTIQHKSSVASKPTAEELQKRSVENGSKSPGLHLYERRGQLFSSLKKCLETGSECHEHADVAAAWTDSSEEFPQHSKHSYHGAKSPKKTPGGADVAKSPSFPPNRGNTGSGNFRYDSDTAQQLSALNLQKWRDSSDQPIFPELIKQWLTAGEGREPSLKLHTTGVDLKDLLTTSSQHGHDTLKSLQDAKVRTRPSLGGKRQKRLRNGNSLRRRMELSKAEDLFRRAQLPLRSNATTSSTTKSTGTNLGGRAFLEKAEEQEQWNSITPDLEVRSSRVVQNGQAVAKFDKLNEIRARFRDSIADAGRTSTFVPGSNVFRRAIDDSQLPHRDRFQVRKCGPTFGSCLKPFKKRVRNAVSPKPIMQDCQGSKEESPSELVDVQAPPEQSLIRQPPLSQSHVPKADSRNVLFYDNLNSWAGSEGNASPKLQDPHSSYRMASDRQRHLLELRKGFKPPRRTSLAMQLPSPSMHQDFARQSPRQLTLGIDPLSPSFSQDPTPQSPQMNHQRTKTQEKLLKSKNMERLAVKNPTDPKLKATLSDIESKVRDGSSASPSLSSNFRLASSQLTLSSSLIEYPSQDSDHEKFSTRSLEERSDEDPDGRDSLQKSAKPQSSRFRFRKCLNIFGGCLTPPLQTQGEHVSDASQLYGAQKVKQSTSKRVHFDSPAQLERSAHKSTPRPSRPYPGSTRKSLQVALQDITTQISHSNSGTPVHKDPSRPSIHDESYSVSLSSSGDLPTETLREQVAALRRSRNKNDVLKTIQKIEPILDQSQFKESEVIHELRAALRRIAIDLEQGRLTRRSTKGESFHTVLQQSLPANSATPRTRPNFSSRVKGFFSPFGRCLKPPCDLPETLSQTMDKYPHHDEQMSGSYPDLSYHVSGQPTRFLTPQSMLPPRKRLHLDLSSSSFTESPFQTNQPRTRYSTPESILPAPQKLSHQFSMPSKHEPGSSPYHNELASYLSTHALDLAIQNHPLNSPMSPTTHGPPSALYGQTAYLHQVPNQHQLLSSLSSQTKSTQSQILSHPPSASSQQQSLQGGFERSSHTSLLPQLNTASSKSLSSESPLSFSSNSLIAQDSPEKNHYRGLIANLQQFQTPNQLAATKKRIEEQKKTGGTTPVGEFLTSSLGSLEEQITQAVGRNKKAKQIARQWSKGLDGEESQGQSQGRFRQGQRQGQGQSQRRSQSQWRIKEQGQGEGDKVTPKSRWNRGDEQGMSKYDRSGSRSRSDRMRQVKGFLGTGVEGEFDSPRSTGPRWKYDYEGTVRRGKGRW